MEIAKRMPRKMITLWKGVDEEGRVRYEVTRDLWNYGREPVAVEPRALLHSTQKAAFDAFAQFERDEQRYRNCRF